MGWTDRESSELRELYLEKSECKKLLRQHRAGSYINTTFDEV